MSNHPTRDGIALTFAMLFPACMAYLYFVVLAGEESDSPLMAVYSVGKLLQFPFPLLFVLLTEPARLRVLPLTTRGIAWGIGFAGLVIIGISSIYFGLLRGTALIEATPLQVFLKLRQFRLDTPASYLGMGLFICLIHSMLEEYYWRWFVFGWLRRYLPLAPALVLSSLGFMLHHVVILGVYFPGSFWTLALPFSLCVAVGGGVWAWIYDRSGSLLGPWISHAIVDTGILLVGYDMVKVHWSLPC